MKKNSKFFLMQFVADESGQALPWMVFLVVLFLGFAGLTLDLGHAYVCYRELQASTDAAALAGAYAMPQANATQSDVTTAVTNFSSASGGINANPNLPSPTITTTLKCLSSVAASGVLCNGPGGTNALQVHQTVTVPTYFIRALGVFGVNSAKTISLGATSTAAMMGATNSQYNVAIVIDTTASMSSNDSDASCGTTRIKCALQGVQTLLQSLSPCTASSTSTSCTAFDQVSLFTYPNVEADTAKYDYDCSSSNPTILNYSTPTAGGTWSTPTGTAATYQVTVYSSDYSSTNKSGGTLSTSSDLAVASGAGKSGCPGLATPGGAGTYYAGAIYAAQSSLVAKQLSNPGSQNALIILSDGDANSTKITAGTHGGNVYGSLDDQCQQAITAANAATAAGTTVYSIAYGAPSSGCSTDTSGSLKGLSPCTAMTKMASSAQTFYSDATASQNKGQCTSASNPSLSLDQIFKSVATSFTVARLIPDNAT